MGTEVKRDWSMVVAGIALAIIGVVFLLAPGITLITVAIVAGVGLFAVGVVDLITYIRFRSAWGLSGWALAYAICDIVLGAALALHPLVSAAVVPWIAGLMLIVYGVFEVIAAWRIRSTGSRVHVRAASSAGVGVTAAVDTSESWGWALASGIAAIVCAVAFFVMPELFAIIIAAFLIVRGVLLVAYGLSAGSAVGNAGAAGATHR